MAGTGNYHQKVRSAREAEAQKEKRRQLQTQQAIFSLSLGSQDAATWEHAAHWQVDQAEPLPNVVEYIRKFGYNAMNGDCWSVTLGAEEQDERPQLRLHLERHVEKAGHDKSHSHTWYLIECTLYTQQCGETPWQSPRRLAQLRVGLHDPLKAMLGDSYAEHFGKSPFARHGGISGTTDRLQEWLWALAVFLNGEKSLPAAVALTLNFFKAHMVFRRRSSQAPAHLATEAWDQGYLQDCPSEAGVDDDLVWTTRQASKALSASGRPITPAMVASLGTGVTPDTSSSRPHSAMAADLQDIFNRPPFVRAQQ